MACDTIKIETLDADEVVSIVTQGPQGPSGAEAATLTTTGDLLYRAALANARLPIGSEGQILKVSSGIPAWGNESGAVTEVNGQTGAVVLDAADVGAAPASGIDPTAITGTAVVDSDARLSDSRTPSSHSSSHASAGSDPLAPSDIGAAWALTVPSTITLSADETLTAGRNVQQRIDTFSATNLNLTLPTSSLQAGDTLTILGTANTTGNIVIRRQNHDGSGFGPQYTTLATITGASQKFTFRASTSESGSWILFPVDTHTHAASDITSGTLTHERGGLEADVSAYNGLVKISGGSTSAVGIGTGSTEVAAGDHGHGNLSSDGKLGSVSGLPVVTTTAGAVTTLALGTAGQVLTVNGTADGVEFAAASGGGISNVDSTLADVMSVSGSNLVADDGGTIDSSDPFIKWNDAAGKLVYANPLSRPSGAFYVGLAPTTTALGSNAVNVQGSRGAATSVASGDNSVCVGANARSAATNSVSIGLDSAVTGSAGVAVGRGAGASGNDSCAYGRGASSIGAQSAAIGFNSFVTAANACGIGNAVVADLRAQFATLPFNAVYWSGQTTTNAATILNLDGTATNRFTIAANTALAVDILLVARRSDTADKWLVARRFLGIRRNGSNGTSLIGSVQTLGTDQSEGSPSWTFALTADDVNECLQLEVTGANSETVQWRATAFYRVA